MTPASTIRKDAVREWAKGHWAGILLALVILGAAATAGTIYLARLQPPPATQTGVVSGLGLTLEIVGLLISVVGFLFTLHQIAEAKTAIELASAETARIRLSLETYEATQDATRAEHLLQDTHRFFNAGDLSSGAKSYSSCADALTMIARNVENLPVEITTGIAEADAYIESLCVRIDKGSEAINAKLKAQMRSHGRLIRVIQTHLQRSAI